MTFRRALALAFLLAPLPALAQSYPPIAMSDADALAEQVRRLGANPLDLDALLTAGELSVRLEDLSAAGVFFTRAEKIDARNGRAKAGEGAILVRSERPGEALRYFALAEQLGAPPARFASDRGLAYDLLGDPGRAQRDYKLALAARDDSETRRRYALSLGIVGRQAQALEQLAPLVRQDDRGAWRARAFILAMGGNAAEASRIAQTMMPPGAATGLASFFAELPRLPVVDRAFAVHFGEVRPTPQRLADARVAPVQAPLALEPLPVRVAAAVPASDKRDKRDRRRRDDRAVAAPVQLAAVQPLPQPPAYQAPAYQAPAYQAPPYQAPYRAPSYRPPAYASTRMATGDRPLTPGEQASLAAAGGRMSPTRSSRRSQASIFPDATRALSAAQRANLAVATGRPPTPAPRPSVLAAATPVRVPAPVPVSVPAPVRREPVVVASALPPSPYALPEATGAGTTGAGTTGAGATGPRAGMSLPTVIPGPPAAIVATQTPALAARTVAPAPTPLTIAPPAALSTIPSVLAPTVTVPKPALAATVPNAALAPTGVVPNTALATAAPLPTPIAGPMPGFTTALSAPVAVPGLNATAPVGLGQAELAAAPLSPLAVAPTPGSGDVATPATLPAAPTQAGPAIAPQQQVALAAPNLVNAPAVSLSAGAPVAGPPAPDTVIAAETTPAPIDVAVIAVPPPAAAAATPIEAPAALVTPVAADRPAPRRPRLAGGEADSILAKIVAGLSIPASELGIDGPTRMLPGAGKRQSVADRRADRAIKTSTDEKPAPDKEASAKKGVTDKKALAAKKEAAAKKAADDKEAADAKAIERTQPARIWVQVAGGADEAALTKAWRTARTKAATAMAGRQGYTTPLRATNRVLTGPFKTDAEARAYVNQLAKAGVSAFTFTSDKGQKITKLDDK